MAVNLRRHLDYLARIDDQLAESLSHGLSQTFPHSLGLLLGLLAQVEDRRATLARSRRAFRAAHTRARLTTAGWLADITELDFPPAPPREAWIARSLDRVGLERAYRRAWLEFDEFLRAGAVAGVHLTGGVKEQAAILRKLAERKFDGGDIDLWDSIRLRMTARDLRGVRALSRDLRRVFGSRVVRVRNYYVRPRQGPDDPYRAIHFEIRDDDGQFIELQVLTALREAVGTVDHALVHRRAPFLNQRHEQWLKELSQTANIMDAQWASPRCRRRDHVAAVTMGASWKSTYPSLPVLAETRVDQGRSMR